jgi:sec-independent protein translocase protein TatC
MALLDRVLQRGPGNSPAGPDDSRMTILEHLEALRRVLIVCFIAWGITTAASLFVWKIVIKFLIDRGNQGHLVYTGPAGALTLGLKISIYLGLILAAPIWIQQLWWFVSPGLHKHERRLTLPLIAATIFFFGLGVSFALVSLPLFMKILNGFAPPDLQYLGFAEEYLSFVLLLVIGFGVVFELPVVLFVLGLLRIVTSKWLHENRFYWIIGLGILANLLTPGVDPITPLFMWIPLYLFWEGTALLLKLMGR